MSKNQRKYAVDEELTKLVDTLYSYSTDFEECYKCFNKGFELLNADGAGLENWDLLTTFSGFFGRFIGKADSEDLVNKYSSVIDNSYNFLSKDTGFQEHLKEGYMELGYPIADPATKDKLLILKDYLKEEDPFEGL